MPSRRLAHRWLNLSHLDQVIDVDGGSAWLEEFDQALNKCSRLLLRFGDDARDRVAAALAERLAHRYDRGYALSGFRIVTVTRSTGRWELRIQMDDMEIH